MTLILDAGALLRLEAGDRGLSTRIKRARLAGTPAVTHGGVIGQVWRGGNGRQAPLASALKHVQVVALGSVLGKLSGLLLGYAGTSDVIDAALVTLAEDGDRILTSDFDDLVWLAEVSGKDVQILPV